jgi:hypothetical protein
MGHREYKFRVVVSCTRFSLWLKPWQTVDDARKVIKICDLAGPGSDSKLILHSEILPGNRHIFELKLGPNDEIVVQPRFGSRERDRLLVRRDLDQLGREFPDRSADDCIDALDANFGNIHLARHWLSGKSGAPPDRVGTLGQIRAKLLNDPRLLQPLFATNPNMAAFGNPVQLLDVLGLNPGDFDLTFAQQPSDKRGDVIARLMRVAPDLGKMIVEQIYDHSNGNEAVTARILREFVAK